MLYKKHNIHHNHDDFVHIHIFRTQTICGENENEGFLLYKWDGLICIISFKWVLCINA